MSDTRGSSTLVDDSPLPRPRPGVHPGVSLRARQTAWVTTNLVVVLYLARLRLPIDGPSVPLILPIEIVSFAFALRTGLLVVNPRRTAHVGFALCIAALCALIGVYRAQEVSIPSLAYLFALYALFSASLTRPRESDDPASSLDLPGVAECFVRTVKPLALLGIAQMVMQFAGWSYNDPFSLLPSSFLLDGYNTTYPIVYNSDIMKANGFFALEPSFFSQACALGALACLVSRPTSRLWPVIFIVATLCAVSGTGILLLIVGTVLYAFSTQLHAAFVATVGAIIVALLLLSPFSGAFSSRLDETHQATGSAHLRFVEPYVDLVGRTPGEDSAASVLLGHGPGTADAVSNAPGAQAPVFAKLFYEYGALGLIVFGSAVLAFILPGSLRPWRLTLLFFFACLSSSLLQPFTVLLVCLLVGICAERGWSTTRCDSPVPSDLADAVRQRVGSQS